MLDEMKRHWCLDCLLLQSRNIQVDSSEKFQKIICSPNTQLQPLFLNTFFFPTRAEALLHSWLLIMLSQIWHATVRFGISVEIYPTTSCHVDNTSRAVIDCWFLCGDLLFLLPGPLQLIYQIL